MRAHDSFARCLWAEFDQLAMPVFSLTDNELSALYRYIDNESRQYDPASIRDVKKSFDSCSLYNKLRDSLEAVRNHLMATNGPAVKIDLASGVHYWTPPSHIVNPPNVPAEYYQFTIRAAGWYNIDQVVTGLPGAENVTLMVHIRATISATFHVFLVIPSDKLITEGGPADQDGEYAFFTDDGKIKLPVGRQAYVFTWAESQQGPVWDMRQFATSIDNQLTLTPASVTKAYIEQAILSLDQKDLSAEVNRTITADRLDSLEVRLSELEKLKPLDWDCDCGEPLETDSSALR